MKPSKSTLAESPISQMLSDAAESYDLIGDIAEIRVPVNLDFKKQCVAQAIMQTQKCVKAVFRQVGGVSGEFRLRRLEWILGEKRTETVHKESGCLFRVDLEKCYFSPRLSFERMRIAKLTQPNEVAVNMFAGVGCFSVLIAKFGGARKVFSVDLNPVAVDFMRENVRLNRFSDRVVPILGDAKGGDSCVFAGCGGSCCYAFASKGF